ncbi:10934_t:CDS:2, partial [Acaulospora morrowiae]
ISMMHIIPNLQHQEEGITMTNAFIILRNIMHKHIQCLFDQARTPRPCNGNVSKYMSSYWCELDDRLKRELKEMVNEFYESNIFYHIKESTVKSTIDPNMEEYTLGLNNLIRDTEIDPIHDMNNVFNHEVSNTDYLGSNNYNFNNYDFNNYNLNNHDLNDCNLSDHNDFDAYNLNAHYLNDHNTSDYNLNNYNSNDYNSSEHNLNNYNSNDYD